MIIDPDSPIPKYFQLREILLDLIEGEELSPDSPIPSERDLCQRYALSRMTVRQGVDHLVTEGRLYRVPGKGTFVARPKIDTTLRMMSFTENMRQRGLRPGSRDLDRRTIPASGHLARMLAVEPGARVHYIERLRTAEGEPMALERSHIPLHLAPDLDAQPLSGRSLYQVLEERYGIVLDAGEQSIEAGIVDPADAELLDLRHGSAVLLFQRRSFASGQCVELAVSTYRADRYQLHTSLENPRRDMVSRSDQEEHRQ